jgi:hypothetical protein
MSWHQHWKLKSTIWPLPRAEILTTTVHSKRWESHPNRPFTSKINKSTTEMESQSQAKSKLLTANTIIAKTLSWSNSMTSKICLKLSLRQKSALKSQTRLSQQPQAHSRALTWAMPEILILKLMPKSSAYRQPMSTRPRRKTVSRFQTTRAWPQI